ncbi:13459_t:CDS:2 [Entrophospora sp. SA101]|nr:9871_t:CDS:2 [Entrophospora sp. SA101]CAJ0908583.1 13459_t:CDS:2 [Entrophospora sp. SA101]
MKIKNQGDTKNAIKTTVKNLNNSDLNNSQQLATVKELLTNHQEKEPKEPISDSDSDDGCIHLLENNDDEVAENIQLGTLQFLLKGHQDETIQQIKQEYSITPNSDYKFLEAMNFMYVKEAGKDKQAVYERATRIFYHYDTLKSSPNHKYVEPLVNELLTQILQINEPDLDKHLKFIDTVKQNNFYDCGVAIIAIIQRIIERYETEYDISDNELSVVELGEFDFPQERKELRERYIRKPHGKKNILTEKKFLEEELKSIETVIQCQTRKNEIKERLRELEEFLFLVHIQMTKE